MRRPLLITSDPPGTRRRLSLQDAAGTLRFHLAAGLRHHSWLLHGDMISAVGHPPLLLHGDMISAVWHPPLLLHGDMISAVRHPPLLLHGDT